MPRIYLQERGRCSGSPENMFSLPGLETSKQGQSLDSLFLRISDSRVSAHEVTRNAPPYLLIHLSFTIDVIPGQINLTTQSVLAVTHRWRRRPAFLDQAEIIVIPLSQRRKDRRRTRRKAKKQRPLFRLVTNVVDD